MKKKFTFKDMIANFDAVITGATLSMCVILVNLNVFFRYFLNSPIKWSEEVVTSLFVWTVFIGSSYAHRKHAHLGVDIVINVLPGKSRAIVQDIMSILEILILLMLTVISAQYVQSLIFSRGAVKIALSDTLRVPKWWTGIAVPIGFGLSLLHSIIFLLRDRLHILKTRPAKDTPEGGEAA
jgi:TRAP-type C4-dicarboxylate transport system permease small subunit